jgi:hypothetical protein
MLELYGDDVLSYPEVWYWSRQFLRGRGHVEDARRTGPHPDFSVQVRSQSALEETIFASNRWVADATCILTTTMFYILREVLGVRVRR